VKSFQLRGARTGGFCFYGEITDGKAKAIFMDVIIKQETDANGTAEILGNCKVKRACYGNDFEAQVCIRVAS